MGQYTQFFPTINPPKHPARESPNFWRKIILESPIFLREQTECEFIFSGPSSILEQDIRHWYNASKILDAGMMRN